MLRPEVSTAALQADYNLQQETEKLVVLYHYFSKFTV